AEVQRVQIIARDELRQEFPDAPTFDGHTRIVGGDFNGTPNDFFDDTTDYMYHRNYRSGAKGEFKEVDSPCGNTMGRLSAPQSYCRDGEATHGQWFPKKIDYIFVDPNVKVQWADATFSEYSDHDPLWAGVTL
ncbi:MAG: hypothetical protein LC799_19230, partial [Actinobacteria bacterium]|nr:hypothetical protein [Actinomycetota bacterium]